MAAPEKCDVCGDRHHKHQAHVFAKPAARDMAVNVTKQTLAYFEAGGMFKASVEPYISRSCKACGKQFDSKRAHAQACSPKCRQKLSRKARAK